MAHSIKAVFVLLAFWLAPVKQGAADAQAAVQKWLLAARCQHNHALISNASLE